MEDVVVLSIRNVCSSELHEQEHALRVLINSSLEDVPRRLIFSNLSLQSLQDALRSTSEVVQMLAAWLLSHMAIDENNCLAILRSGILDKLMLCLKSDNVDLVEKALWVANNLLNSDVSEEFVERFGMIEVLIQLVSSSSVSISCNSARNLECLVRKDSCEYYKENQRTFCEKGGMTVLSQNLVASHPPKKKQTVSALLSLLHVFALYNDEEMRKKITECGIPKSLLEHIEHPLATPQLREQCLRILFNLSLSEQCMQPLVSAGIVLVLMSQIQNQMHTQFSHVCTELSFFALTNLIVLDSTRRALRGQLLPEIMALFGINLREYARKNRTTLEKGGFVLDVDKWELAYVEFIANSACDTELRSELQSIEILSAVNSLSHSQNEAVKEMAAVALSNLQIAVAKKPKVPDEAAQSKLIKSASDMSAEALSISSAPMTRGKVFGREDSSSADAAALAKRARIIKEFFQSEQAYVTNLAVALRVYQKPLTEKVPLSREQVQQIFINIQQIFEMHSKFVSSLGAKMAKFEDGEENCISDLFLAFWREEKHLNTYKHYVTNYGTSQTIMSDLQSKNVHFYRHHETCANEKDARGLPLHSFLIQPIQRVPRYVLLLADLLKSTPTDNPMYMHREIALAQAKYVGDSINEAQREAEKAAKMKQISDKLTDVPKGFVLMGLRECLHDGLLVESRFIGSRHIHLFLFPGLLMCTLAKKKVFKIEYMISLKTLQVILIPPDKATGQCLLSCKWKDRNIDKDFKLCVSDKEAKLWMQMISKAQAAMQ